MKVGVTRGDGERMEYLEREVLKTEEEGLHVVQLRFEDDEQNHQGDVLRCVEHPAA